MKEHKNGLIENTVYLYLLTIVKMLFPIITLPYLTRILSVEIYGVVAYVKAYISYMQLLLDFGFLLSATKHIAKEKSNNQKIGLITGNTIIEKGILGVLGFFITLIAVSKITILQQNILFLWLYFISCMITIFIPDFLYRGLEKMQYVAIPFAFSKIIVIFMTFILVHNDGDYLMIPILEIIGNAVAAFISMFFVKNIGIRITFGSMRNWIEELKESSIYFFSNFATTFFGALTTIIVGACLRKTDIAYWSICMQIVSAAKSMYAPLSNSLYPHMVVSKEIKVIKKISILFSFPIVVGTILILFYGEWIMGLIGGNNYESAGTILRYLIPVFIASFYSMLYGWPVLGAIEKIKETTLSTIVSAMVQLLGIYILISVGKFQLYNLAICCDVSEILLLIIRLIIYKKNSYCFVQ